VDNAEESRVDITEVNGVTKGEGEGQQERRQDTLRMLNAGHRRMPNARIRSRVADKLSRVRSEPEGKRSRNNRRRRTRRREGGAMQGETVGRREKDGSQKDGSQLTSGKDEARELQTQQGGFRN
jgi:hypothetical protein